MSSYRDLFLSETREHINNLNKLVVTLEQEEDDRETIDALFREAHSIKGMAATMGYDRTARLSHHLEDLLDGFRASGVVPSPAVDHLLDGIDLLEHLLDDLEREQPERDVEAFMAQAPSLAPSPAEATAEDAPETDTAPPETSDDNTPVAVAAAEEPDTFQVLIELAEDTPAAAARGILILRELEKIGELKSSKPDLAALRGGAPCEKIQAWLCSSLTKDHVEEALLKISGVARVRFIDDRRKEDRRQQDGAVPTIRVRTDLLDQFVNLAGELITHRHMLHTATADGDWPQLKEALGQAGRLIDDLHHHVLQARLMPLENITGRLPRIVRDLSKKLEKKVTLRLTGTDVGIDRVILEELTDPLVHLVRNAVDHGIEGEGVVTVSARREKDLVLVEVADNGKGMDPGQLRRKALARGLITEAQAESLSDRDALMLVCQPGFSTAEEITETSGRGVGMDVVKAAVNNLGGTLDILSEPGSGTRFQMRLPLSIAIIKILLVRCAGQILAIPITRIQRNLDLATAAIRALESQRVFDLDEEVIPLYSLNEVLGLPSSPAGEISWTVLTEVQGRRIGLQVDQLIGHREAFVKPIGFPLNEIPGLSGATVEGNGQVVFVIDPQALMEHRQHCTPETTGRS